MGWVFSQDNRRRSSLAETMTPFAIVASLAFVFATSFVSGVFGMAGGLLLMGGLLLFLPVPLAMVAHGVVQFVSNFSRTVILRRHLRRGILIYSSLGTAAAVAGFIALRYAPDRALVYLFLGFVPFLIWLPERWLELDANRPLHGFLAGVASGGLTVAAGVAGPAVDIFFVRTTLDRRAIVATKSFIQSLSHVCKVLFYGSGAADLGLEFGLLIAAAIPMAIAGTHFGAKILERLTDQGYREFARYLITAIGVVYLFRAAQLLWT
jgi:uncharacterized membrane protein YfcA